MPAKANKQLRRVPVAVPGPYVPKNDGAVYYSFPHGADREVVLCNESDPGHVASMLNFALAKGFEGAVSKTEDVDDAKPHRSPNNPPRGRVAAVRKEVTEGSAPSKRNA